MRKDRVFYLVSFFISIFMLSVPFQVHAANGQTSFNISPPPIPWFEFTEDQLALKLGADYVSLSGDDLSLKGGGGQGLARIALSDMFAIDGGFGMMFTTGDVAGFDMEFVQLNAPLDLEMQLINNEYIVMILFGGINIACLQSTTSYNYGTNDEEEATIDTNMWSLGLVGGVQGSIKLFNFALSPFYMFQRVNNADADITMTFTDGPGYTASQKIPSYTSNTFGIDISYIPWGIVLSSMLNILPATGDQEEIRTILFSISIKLDSKI